MLLSWFGDGEHKLDVRAAALILGIKEKERGGFEQQYTSNLAQAEYWASLPLDLRFDQPTGTSLHSIGTAFEAAYMANEFRVTYLDVKFGPDIRKRILEIRK